MLNIHDLVEESHATAIEKGWWDQDRSFGELIALCHSELSEALEAWRDEDPPLHYEEDKPEGWLVELADVLIRVGDMVGGLSTVTAFEEALEAKFAFNRTRPYRHGNKRA